MESTNSFLDTASLLTEKRGITSDLRIELDPSYSGRCILILDV